MEELTQNTPIGCKTALVTNKCDLAFREVPEEDVRNFAHQNNLLYYETSALWNRDDDEFVMNSLNKGGIGVLIDSMVEEIIDDIVTERLSNVHNNTLGVGSASECGQYTTPRGRENPFGGHGQDYAPYPGRVSGAIRLGGGGGGRTLYEAEEDNGCQC